MTAPRPKLDIDRTRERLIQLNCLNAAEQVDALLAEAVRLRVTAHEFLAALLEAEVSGRETRRVRTSLRRSTLPTGQTLANVDFAFQPAIELYRIEVLATCAWVRNAETVLIQGPPGVGKTQHLAIALGIKAVEQGFSVQHFRIGGLLNEMRGDATLPPARLRPRKSPSNALW